MNKILILIFALSIYSTIYGQSIGSNYGGGILFYNDGAGNGLVCATSDQSGNAAWGCQGTNLPGAEGMAVGTGAQNTIDILNGCSTSGIAADLCANYSGGGYTDWFLPSVDELHLMYQNIGPGASGVNNNIGGFVQLSNYWSSTEQNAGWAWIVYFNGGTKTQLSKDGPYADRVRAIRQVSLPPPVEPFITTWKTDNPGTSCNSCITIPTFGTATYNYDVDWDNDGTFDQFGITGDVTHGFGVVGTYTIRIQGVFPRIFFNNSGDRGKIVSIDQWGSNAWKTMRRAFYGCSNLIYNATDVPNLSAVTDTEEMFRDATLFSADLNSWDVSNIIKMNGMFRNADSFNSDLSNWDVSSVTNMGSIFSGNNAFNGNISSWDVSSVTNMNGMFNLASSFNQSLENWDLSSVNSMVDMISNSGLSVTNYDNTLIGWESQGVTNLTLGANGLDYCNGEVARTSLINTYGWTITGDNYDCSVLPLEFLHFDAISVYNTIVLTWSTTSETNNAGFDIQRSRDGLDWEAIGFVEGRGSINERNDYEYIDRQPLIGNNYYRLKQIDYDGSYEFSDVSHVFANSKSIPDLLVYPNPSSGTFTLTINNPQRHKANIRILDMTGSLHWSRQFSASERSTSWTQEIDISKTGVYFVVSQIGSEVITEKVMVVDF